MYDSNIPAKYGQFSGGLVLAETKNAGNKTRFGFSYRQTADDFVQYHTFYAPKFSGDDILDTATFTKKDFSAYVETPITENSGLIAQIQVLTSSESLNQLGTIREQKQNNYNGLIKYHIDVSPDDELTFRYLNAPYKGNYFNVDAIDSDYEITGGGQSFVSKWHASRHWGDAVTQVDWRQSENTKSASNTWYVWANVPGKSWGNYNGSTTSLSGGYGDIEKTQDTYTLRQDFDFTPWSFKSTEHSVSLGYQIEKQTTVFDRLEDAIFYNGAVISPQVNCGGYTLIALRPLLFALLKKSKQN